MGMTIDDATLYMELYKRKLFNSVSDLDKDIEAYDIAISTMRKYQQIEKIMEEWLVDNGAFAMSESYWLNTIRKVIEDGNDNR